MLRHEARKVIAAEAVGPYTLLRVERGSLDPGTPGRFFMLDAPGRLLPRPMSVCVAPAGELGFLIDPIGPGTRALCELSPGDRLGILGPLGNGFRLEVERPLLVGGGIGVAPLPYLSEALGRPPAVLGFRTEWHAEAAALVANAEVVIEPTYVTGSCRVNTTCSPVGRSRCRGRSPPAARSWPGRRQWPGGYGACHGCAVEIDGELKRLCVEGSVLRLLNASGRLDALTAPQVARSWTRSSPRR
jgi:dihydroorotate dehydrogenase electron transfer subunit